MSIITGLTWEITYAVYLTRLGEAKGKGSDSSKTGRAGDGLETDSMGRRTSSSRTVKNELPGARRREGTLMGGQAPGKVSGGREVLTIPGDHFLRLLSREQCWCPLPLSP